MLGSLYGSLPKVQAKNAEKQDPENAPAKSSGWAATSAPMGPARKPAAPFGPPRSVLKHASKPTSAMQRHQAIRSEAATASAGAVVPAVSNFGSGLRDEYDPARPNDYEEVRQRREQARIDAEREAQRQEELRLTETVMASQREAQEAAAQAVLAAAERPADRSAALAVSGEEAFARRGRLSAVADGLSGPAAQTLQQAAQALGGGEKGMGLAAKMMERMGWREGSGLGRNKQGIVAPLIAQKTDRRGGVIVGSTGSASEAGPVKQEQQQGPGQTTAMGPPTRVVLLRNMVGPGQVDPQLEDEVGEECEKYGSVQSVSIFEVIEDGWRADEAVRIFVEFSRIEEATKAIIDLGGRFFGGRQVKAAFFDEARFEKGELAPQAGEFAF